MRAGLRWASFSLIIAAALTAALPAHADGTAGDERGFVRRAVGFPRSFAFKRQGRRP